MLAGARKQLERARHIEIYLLGLKVQYKPKLKLPLDMVRNMTRKSKLKLIKIDKSVSGIRFTSRS